MTMADLTRVAYGMAMPADQGGANRVSANEWEEACDRLASDGINFGVFGKLPAILKSS